AAPGGDPRLHVRYAGLRPAGPHLPRKRSRGRRARMSGSALLDYGRRDWGTEHPVKPLDLASRPVAFFAPYSYLGTIYGPMIAERCPGLVAVVDDHYRDERIHGAPRWSSATFR